jgi:hypothetical protein
VVLCIFCTCLFLVVSLPAFDCSLSKSKSKSKSLYDWCRAPLWGPWPDFTFSFLLSENCFSLFCVVWFHVLYCVCGAAWCIYCLLLFIVLKDWKPLERAPNKIQDSKIQTSAFQRKSTSGHKSQSGLGTKTYWLTDSQLQSNSDSEWLKLPEIFHSFLTSVMMLTTHSKILQSWHWHIHCHYINGQSCF